MRLFKRVIISGLLGLVIGAAAGLLTSDFGLDGAAAGALLGALLGMGFGARMDAHREASAKAMQHHIDGTRSLHSARHDLMQQARKDQALASGIYAGDHDKGQP